MGTSLGAVIDHLVDVYRNGTTIPDRSGTPITYPPLSTVNPAVEVADNITTTTDGVWVVIGRASPESGGAGDTQFQYVELGAGRVEETYTLPCIVKVVDEGPDQKGVRDKAIALFDACVRVVNADATLGGLLTRGRVALISSLSLTQTQDDEDTGASGGLVTAEIDFGLQIQNTYIP